MFSWENEPTIDRSIRSDRPAARGVARLTRPADAAPTSDARSRQPVSNDEPLSDLARRWVDTLPTRLRPAALCARYARIANRLALCWPDARLTQQLFESLLVDRRGGRKGFPAPVRAELFALRDACELAALRAARERAAEQSRTLVARAREPQGG